MEDIDKDGDGLIDLNEYIGEFLQPVNVVSSPQKTFYRSILLRIR